MGADKKKPLQYKIPIIKNKPQVKHKLHHLLSQWQKCLTRRKKMTPVPSVGDGAKRKAAIAIGPTSPVSDPFQEGGYSASWCQERQKPPSGPWHTGYRVNLPKLTFPIFSFFKTTFSWPKHLIWQTRSYLGARLFPPSPGHDSDPNVSTKRIGHRIKALCSCLSHKPSR